MKSRILFLASSLVVLALVVAHPALASAVTTMKVTNGNLTTLKGFPATAYGTSSKLKYSYGVKLTAYGKKEYKISGYYRIGKPGWCVEAARSLANKNSVSTSRWIKGPRVTAGGVAPGTVIATFDSRNKYSGHAAILKRYLKNSTGKITGVEVWDQNWARPHDHLFRKHVLSKRGTARRDADNYYTVRY